MRPYKIPKSQDISPSTVLWKQDGYITKKFNNYSYYQLRTLFKVPLIYRCANGIIQNLLAHDWTIECSNSRAEKWINQAFAPIMENIVSNSSACYYYGFQVGEVYFTKYKDNKWHPRVKFPFPDYIEIKMDELNEYGGFRQKYTKNIEVDADNSILWTFGSGVGTHNNPYGSGILDVVYSSAKNYISIMNKILLMADRQNWPVTILDVPGTGTNQDSLNDFAKELANLPYKDIPFCAFKNYDPENSIKPVVISPEKGAIEGSLKAADQYLRDIALGMLVSLRTFYNSPNDGGSYSLTQIQQTEFDRVVKGLWRTIKPGIDKIIKKTLKINFGLSASNNFEFNIEHHDEITRTAARDLFNSVIKDFVDVLDINKLSGLSGLHGIIREPDENMVSDSEELEGG